MNRKELGLTGVLIPEVGIGTWHYHGGVEPLRRGLEAGACFIDTAESYGTEEIIGKAISGWPSEIFIATKVSPQNFRSGDLKRSVDMSLARLGIDRIDLLQLHEPNSRIPIGETMNAVADLVCEGKVRFAGVSNFSIQQFEAAQAAFWPHRLVSNQVRYSIIDRTIEDGLLQHHRRNGITVIAYCPLGRDMQRIDDCDPSGVIDELVQATGRTRAQIVLNWCLCKDGVVVIPKGNSEAHVIDNCGASGWRLTEEEIKLLDSRIRYRRRGRLDVIIRRYTPSMVRTVALRAAGALPRGVRRRLF
jgi:diketogulonate reductase-like aldo/keto reductase